MATTLTATSVQVTAFVAVGIGVRYTVPATHVTLTGKPVTVLGVSSPISVTVPPAHLTVTGQPLAAAAFGSVAVPPVAHLSVRGKPVRVVNPRTLVPATSHIKVTGTAVSTTQTSVFSFTPGTAHLTLTGRAGPGLNEGITVGTAHVTVQGKPVTVRANQVDVTPATARLIMRGYLPGAFEAGRFRPATAHLILRGRRPLARTRVVFAEEASVVMASNGQVSAILLADGSVIAEVSNDGIMFLVAEES